MMPPVRLTHARIYYPHAAFSRTPINPIVCAYIFNNMLNIIAKARKLGMH